MKVSTVSRHVGALEADLGVALLNRSTLTFYDRAQSSSWRRSRTPNLAASAFNSRPMGLLKVSLPPSFGRLHEAPHHKDFSALYPDIQLDIC